MPHAALKLVPGVDTQETPVLNEASGISVSNLIRFFYDPNGLALVAKIGGWVKFFATPMLAIVRALWAWEDINNTSHLAFGTTLVTTTSQLGIITNGVLTDITPLAVGDNVPPAMSTITGSATVVVTDTTVTGVSNAVSVYITTQISIGGLVLFGLYKCDFDNYYDANTYTIQAVDQLGVPLPATATTAITALPLFAATAESPVIIVTLPSYTYPVGDTFPVLVPTEVGGITLYGNYIVQYPLISDTEFSILAATPALTTGTNILNNGNAQYIYTGSDNVPPSATQISATEWTLDNWGATLIACAIQPEETGFPPFQPIYQWSPGQGNATIIPQAPPVNDGIFVAMPQRQIVAWGSTETGIQDPLLIAWCDVGNYNSWIPTVTNQAGTYRIAKGSKIVGCVQGPQQALIWTDIDVWSMQYIGPPYVYSFNEVGSGCGLIGRKAAAAYEGIYYWMGPKQFFTLSSSGVQILTCTVWDVVYQNLNPNTNYYQNIRVAVNSLYGEISWFYPSAASPNGENDSYVKYTVQLGIWDYGSLARSAWIDQSVLGPPIGADPANLYLYQHETSNDADGTAMLPSFTSGYFAIGEGDVKSFVDWVWPDMKWSQYDEANTSATVLISFLVKDYPTDAPTTYGPYLMNSAIEYFYTRFRGRLVAVQIQSNDLGTWWRLGLIRYRYAPDGRI
jgi:hypothetical protein